MVLLGCGLRRSEAVTLRLDQLQLRDNHWVIVDLSREGRMTANSTAPGPVPKWNGVGDPRAQITPGSLLRMGSGLDAPEAESGFDPASQMLMTTMTWRHSLCVGV
jgi:hypothetical protein